MAIQQIRPGQLKTWLDDSSRGRPLLLDVREAWELEVCKLPGSLHIPMGTVPDRSGEIDPETPVVVICHHGGRSMQVAAWLERQGFEKLHNLAGGLDAWAREVEPSMAVY